MHEKQPRAHGLAGQARHAGGKLCELFCLIVERECAALNLIGRVVSAAALWMHWHSPRLRALGLHRSHLSLRSAWWGGLPRLHANLRSFRGSALFCAGSLCACYDPASSAALPARAPHGAEPYSRHAATPTRPRWILCVAPFVTTITKPVATLLHASPMFGLARSSWKDARTDQRVPKLRTHDLALPLHFPNCQRAVRVTYYHLQHHYTMCDLACQMVGARPSACFSSGI